MAYHLENQSVNLGPFYGTCVHYSDPFLHISSADDAMDGVLIRFPKHIQCIICILGWINVLVFSYFRYSVYNHLLQKHRIRDMNPIDRLILISCIVQHLGVVIYQGCETLRVTTRYPQGNTISTSFYELLRLFLQLSLIHI